MSSSLPAKPRPSLVRLRLAAFLAALAPAALSATDYYVNGSTGLDTHPGTQAQPWKTLARVNQHDFNTDLQELPLCRLRIHRQHRLAP